MYRPEPVGPYISSIVITLFYLQNSEVARSKGRAYRCKRCGKVDRKGRLMGDVLKDHVPIDRVPFYCAYFSFRCQEKSTLLDHMKNYKRHRV